MAIKNLDKNLFSDNEDKELKQKKKNNPENDLAKMLEGMFSNVEGLDLGNLNISVEDMSKSLENLKSFDFGNFKGMAIPLEIPISKSVDPNIYKLQKALTAYNAKGKKPTPLINEKILELVDLLIDDENKKIEKIEEVKIVEEKKTNKYFSILAQYFDLNDFLATYNFINEDTNLTLKDLSNIKFVNLNEEDVFVEDNSYLLYNPTKKINNKFSERFLLYYPNKKSRLALPYKTNDSYKVLLLDKYESAKDDAFYEKRLNFASSAANVIFYQENEYKLNEIGSLIKLKFDINDNVVKIGRIKFHNNLKASEFRQANGVGDDIIDVDLLFSNDFNKYIKDDLILYFRELDFNDEILNNLNFYYDYPLNRICIKL